MPGCRSQNVSLIFSYVRRVVYGRVLVIFERNTFVFFPVTFKRGVYAVLRAVVHKGYDFAVDISNARKIFARFRRRRRGGCDEAARFGVGLFNDYGAFAFAPARA